LREINHKCNVLISSKMQYASRSMLMFISIWNVFKSKILCIVKWTKEVIHTLQTALTIQVNYQKEVIICKNSPNFMSHNSLTSQCDKSRHICTIDEVSSINMFEHFLLKCKWLSILIIPFKNLLDDSCINT
jgi:hypothetical protein